MSDLNPNPTQQDTELCDNEGHRVQKSNQYDRPEEIGLLLKAAIDPESFEPTTYLDRFESFAAIAILSQKYQINELLEKCRSALEDEFPMTLSSFDNVGYLHYPAIGVSALAKKMDWPWILPSAYYRAVQEDNGLYDLSRGFAEKYPALASSLRIEDEDCRKIFKGSNTLLREAHEMMIRCAAIPNVYWCNARPEYHTGKINELRRYAYNTVGRRTVSPLEKHHLLANKSGGVSICHACYSQADERLREEREELWNNLPKVFGLPDWKELENRKEQKDRQMTTGSSVASQ